MSVAEKTHWEQEEFEDLVARALIACYEDKLINTEPKKVKGGARWVRSSWKVPRQKDIERMRSIGPYFIPEDRLMLNQEYWYDLDGLPENASFAFHVQREEGLIGHDAYLEIFTLHKVDQLPPRCFLPPGQYVAKYMMLVNYPKQSGLECYRQYIGIRKNGKVTAAMDAMSLNGDEGQNQTTFAIAGGATLGAWADRKYLWNVVAQEGNQARALFGVYEDQIKSLFYSREVPLTVTGRKRPILHWVKSHQRRMESGIDVDIEKYLRGTTEFEMDGTLFTITNPIKRVGNGSK